MTKKKKKLTPERRARKQELKEKFEWVYMNGKQEKVRKNHFDSDFLEIITDVPPLAGYLINLEINESLKQQDRKIELSRVNQELRIIANGRFN